MEINLKIVISEILSPLDLTKAQTSYIYKLTEVVIIFKIKNHILIAFQEMIPNLKYFNNN